MLQCLALSQNTALHLLSELLVDFEVLDLKSAVALFLRVDQLCRHREFQLCIVQLNARAAPSPVFIETNVGKVRYAFVHVFVKSRWLHLVVILGFRLVGHLSHL